MKKFITSENPEPHKSRGREIMLKYPEVKTLFGPTPTTAIFIFLILVAQMALSFAAPHMKIWEILILAYIVGATLNHALFVLIHDCTHNLVFKGTLANRIWAMIANLPQGVPRSDVL